jgi:hypothetical protein
MKQIKSKYITAGCAVLMACVVYSCTKGFVDKAPQGSITTVGDSATAVQVTNGIYGILRSWPIHVFAWLGITEIASDEADKGSTPTDASFFLDLKNYTVSAGSQGASSILNPYWVGQYQAINRANIAINSVPKVEGMSTALKNRLVGEASFLRAYFYFNLVRTFGGVPLILSDSSLDANNTARRATAQQVYAQIETDLNVAINSLPLKSDYSAGDLGRITKGAAQTLLAKVSMYEKKWDQVLALTNAVMTSGQYSLYTDFSKLFTQAAKNSSESIFEVQSGAGSTCNAGTQYPQVQLPRDPSGSPGWGFNNPSASLVNAFEPGDPRLKATVIFPGDTLYDGWVCPTNVVNPRYNKKAYIGAADYAACGSGDAPKNIIILRYAEVLLMHAEAANELGQSSLALADLEQVRARARGGRAGVLPQITTTDQAQLRQLIWHERQVELAMEQDRWWDVVRQGRGAQVFGAQGFKAGKNEVWPIPADQIAVAPQLDQNPGY